MKKINKYLFIFIALAAFMVTSCLDQTEVDFGKGPIVVQFPKSVMSPNYVKDGTGSVIETPVIVEYYGANGLPLSEPVTVDLAVDQKSTAVQGQYELTQTQITIPADTNRAEFKIKVYPDKLDPYNPPSLIIKMTNSSQKASSNKGEIEVILNAICPSHLAGKYIYTNGRTREVDIVEIGTGKYSISADNAFAGLYPLYFSDFCGDLTIYGGYLPENFGIGVSGTGSVDEATGQITLYYTVDGYFENRPMILKKL